MQSVGGEFGGGPGHGGGAAGTYAGVCVFTETCGRALAIEHNGDVLSCDHYVYPRYTLGNLLSNSFDAMVESRQQRAFGAAKSSTLPRYVRECWVKFACHGECLKQRFLRTPHNEPGLNHLCTGYTRFFTHIDSPMRTMGALLAMHSAPADITLMLRAQWLPSRLKK